MVLHSVEILEAFALPPFLYFSDDDITYSVLDGSIYARKKKEPSFWLYFS